MSKKRYCCISPVYGSNCGNQTCFGNVCNPFCLVVLLMALKKGGIIESQSTIEALFFLFLLLCCCGNNNNYTNSCYKCNCYCC